MMAFRKKLKIKNVKFDIRTKLSRFLSMFSCKKQRNTLLQIKNNMRFRFYFAIRHFVNWKIDALCVAQYRKFNVLSRITKVVYGYGT